MIVNRRGITRTVILVGRWAIKVPSTRPGVTTGMFGRMWSFTRGIQANLSERQWTAHATTDPICPVLWSLLGLVNVYPRCEPIPVGPDGETAAIPLPAREWFHVGDDKAENFGLLNGEVVWVDYDVSYAGCEHDPGGVNARRGDIAAGRRS